MLFLYLAILAGKITKKLSRFFKLGAGGTWSGEIALFIYPNLIERIGSEIKNLILVTGTNGKTTTVKMIKTLLGDDSFSNESGANLLNGIAGALAENYSEIKKGLKKTAVLEVDEAVFPHLLKKLRPKTVLILNLFRDQLDRFGEVNTIAKIWGEALSKLDSSTSIILNADDPQVAFLGYLSKVKVVYFGLNSNQKDDFKNRVEMWADSFLCPRCNFKLSFKKVFFSHLGVWHCENCQLARPKIKIEEIGIKTELVGEHNRYNALAALLTAKTIRKLDNSSSQALLKMEPAFGRWEEFSVSDFKNKQIVLILSKNPTGMTQNLRIISQRNDIDCLMIVLNDNIPDGRDVSWIWDIDIPKFRKEICFITSGKRFLDMALRLKYEDIDGVQIENGADLKKAVQKAVSMIKDDKKLYILATYSAMLETRKIITGRKIL